jgi:hypothetical protein
MLPVEISSSFGGVPESRCVSTKSESFVIRILLILLSNAGDLPDQSNDSRRADRMCELPRCAHPTRANHFSHSTRQMGVNQSNT